MDKKHVANKQIPATLALADGTIFRGYNIGIEGETFGEVVFNTSMTGYQEILTDPSYAMQMITFTYPHIGNVGVNSEDVESDRIHATGLIVRKLSPHYSNFRAERSLQSYLEEQKIVGIAGIDTRKLVVHLRETGAQMGVIASGNSDASQLVAKARALPSMEGQDLVKQVATTSAYDWTEGVWSPGGVGYRKYSQAELQDRPLVLVIDCGVKRNILRLLVDVGFKVKVLPPTATVHDVLELRPQGVFLSNGPGDPAVVHYVIDMVKGILGKVPIFGICLGHQILGLALGVSTYKLKFGHRGGNHPVRREASGRVEITAQNHGFASEREKLADACFAGYESFNGADLSHINLNDQTVSGLEVEGLKAFSVQYHPEASPGPHDSQYLFEKFKSMTCS